MAFRHFLVGIMGGVVSGIYIAQNYEVPDVRTYFSGWIAKAREAEKQRRRGDD